MPIVVATSTSAAIADIAMESGATAYWTKAQSLSPEMSENLWRLWEAENEEGDGTASAATDADSGAADANLRHHGAQRGTRRKRESTGAGNVGPHAQHAFRRGT